MFYPYTEYDNQDISKRLRKIYDLVHKNKTTLLSNDDARFLLGELEFVSVQLHNLETFFDKE